MPARIRSACGFTMVELLVVILLIGILVMIALPAFLGQRHKGEDTEAQQTIRTAVTALATHHTDTSTYDATKAQLVAVEPVLAEATPALTVTGTASDFAITETSGSGTTFTYMRAASGTVSRACSDHGRGLCRTSADASGDFW